jgi:hypothetical protein
MERSDGSSLPIRNPLKPATIAMLTQLGQGSFWASNVGAGAGLGERRLLARRR